MAKIDLKSKEWVDLIFEGRNKEYGAYRLRKNAGKRTLYAVIWVAIGIVAILMAVGLYMGVSAAIASMSDNSATELSNLEYEDKKKEEKKKDEKKEDYTPPPPKEEKQQEAPKSEVKQEQPKQEAAKMVSVDLQQMTNVKVKQDAQVKNAMESNETYTQNKSVKSDLNFAGNKFGSKEGHSGLNLTNSLDRGSTSDRAGHGTGSNPTATGQNKLANARQQAENAHTSSNNPTRHPPVEAKYPGNWIQYLQSHLKYPAIAIEQEVQGIVRIEFVVGKDGSISQMKVLKSLSKECDAEAMRVIRGAKWTPGKDEQGNPITSYKTQEVQFVLQ